MSHSGRLTWEYIVSTFMDQTLIIQAQHADLFHIYEHSKAAGTVSLMGCLTVD